MELQVNLLFHMLSQLIMILIWCTFCETGVVPLLDSFWDRPRGLAGAGSYRVLVMPLMQSVADNDRCEAEHPLTLREISLCARHILEALVELHEVRGIMHMDIKPSNILYTREPSLRFMLTDFGQAQVQLWFPNPN